MTKEGHECRLYIVGGTQHQGWLKNIPWWKEIKSDLKQRPLRLLSQLYQSTKELKSWLPDAIVGCDTTTVRIARWSSALAGASGVPVFCWLHCSYKFQKMQIELARADANLCICKERADEARVFLQQTGASESKSDRVFLVYSGTSIGLRPPIPRASIPTFVFAGRIQYGSTKRIKDLIEAAALLRGDFRIKLLGDGEEGEKKKIRDRAEELGITDKIQWLGWHLDSWNAVDEATAMVLPSDAEGFSMVTIEALALGLPVILADFGGVSREAVVNQGETGWIFPVADVPALAKILQGILDDPTSIPEQEFVRRFGHRFSSEQMVVDFMHAMQVVLGEKHVQPS